jgi:hypothetical protein
LSIAHEEVRTPMSPAWQNNFVEIAQRRIVCDKQRPQYAQRLRMRNRKSASWKNLG